MNHKNIFEKLISEQKKIFRRLVLFTAIMNILMLTPSIFMLEVYDKVLTSRNEFTLYALSFITLLLYLIYGLLDGLRGHIVYNVSLDLEKELSNDVYEAIFKETLKKNNNNTSQPLADLTTIKQFLTTGALFSFFDAPWFPIYLVVIFMFNFWLGILAIFCITTVVVIAIINEVTTKDSNQKSSVLSSQSNIMASNILKNSEVLDAMGMMSPLKKKWNEIHKKFLEVQEDATFKSTNVSTVTKVVKMILQSAMLGVAAYLVLIGSLLPGMMIASSLLIGKAMTPVEQVITGWKQYKQAKMAFERIKKLLNDNPKDKYGISLPKPKGTLSVEKLYAAVKGKDVPVLTDVSFHLEPGDILGVIGPSGSGKSTLARELVGGWPALQGKVRLDGVDIHTWNKTELGPSLGYVPQDIELFQGSISDNICRFYEANDEEIVKAAKAAGIHELILKMPDGYNTQLGVDGLGVSGGQKQRIAIARSLYKDPVFIVMDEPNSNLDTNGEKDLVTTLESCKERKATVVIITHRATILKATTKLLYLENGSVKAFGPTAEVLKKLNGKPETKETTKVAAKTNKMLEVSDKKGELEVETNGETI